MSKRDKPFNNPFGGLKLKVEEKSKPPKAPTRVEPKAPPEEDESALFLSSVGEVVPVKKGAPRVEPPVPESKLAHVVDPEVEALTELAELVAGNGPLDLADTDEYIEGSAPGLDPRILRRLRKGDYAVQGHLDLHGLTRMEAKEALVRFVFDARSRGKRCVLIVHGRGLHSKDQIPVLKASLQTWLSHGKLAERVLAFTSARPHDGGAGAVYVLLRK